MSYITSTNILSPLGPTTAANLAALREGKSPLCPHQPTDLGVADPFTASFAPVDPTPDHTPFEHLCLSSIRDALLRAEQHVDLSSPHTVLILSTTKGNVESLLDGSPRPLPADAAQHIADALGLTTPPVVVCDACISGLAAIILADRLLEGGVYDTALVCGADIPRKFIVSGFQSLKALSADDCRPFDIDRNGLNLGQAAATVIMSRQGRVGQWHICGSAIRNDAFHLSAPHRQGEGLRLAIEQALQGVDPQSITLINAHATATLFNDQMESVAIDRAGLASVPVNGLKGYYGHTMGAAGVLETIVSTQTLEAGYALPTRGFTEPGVSGHINVIAHETPVPKGDKTLLKLLSGFGGCNAALLLTNAKSNPDEAKKATQPQSQSRLQTSQILTLKTQHTVTITPTAVTVDGQPLAIEDAPDADLLTRIYKQHVGGYPKFYKMDQLSRLGFLATELLLAQESAQNPADERFTDRSDRAVILFNRTSSLHTDAIFADGIKDPANYFPSPSIFLYTLPNIMTGEIAIRNHYHGETSLFMLPRRDDDLMRRITLSSFADCGTTSAIVGWVDFCGDGKFEAEVRVVSVGH